MLSLVMSTENRNQGLRLTIVEGVFREVEVHGFDIPNDCINNIRPARWENEEFNHQG
jgi:hypothetical protein